MNNDVAAPLVSRRHSFQHERLLRGLLLCALVLLGACGPPTANRYAVDAPPLVLTAAHEAGITDDRGRFREILCAINEARGADLSHPRPCEDILQPGGPPPTNRPVDLGPPQTKLLLLMVPGAGAECAQKLIEFLPAARAHVEAQGFATREFVPGGLASSTYNAGLIRDEVMGLDLQPDTELVLLGYSKGVPDILETLVLFPEVAARTAAVVGLVGAVGGSPLALDASSSLPAIIPKLPGTTCDSVGDGKIVESLTPAVRQQWLAEHDLPDGVLYLSLGAFTDRERVSSVMKKRWSRLAVADNRNDGQVITYDQIIPGSTLLGYLNADHWAVAIPLSDIPVANQLLINHNTFPREVMLEAVLRYLDERLRTRGAVAPPSRAANPTSYWFHKELSEEVAHR